jgi:hypothetical protein
MSPKCRNLNYFDKTHAMKKIIFSLIPMSLAFLFSSTAALAATANFNDPLGQNMSNVTGIMVNAQSYLNAVAATIAMIFIIIGSAMYIVAAFGNKNTAALGKTMIMYAIGGFAIVVGAPVIYKEIMNILQGNPANVASASPMAKILLGGLKGFLVLVGLYAIISFLIGGIAYFLAWGDETRVERAKKILKYALIGSIIAIGAMVIARQILQLLGG